MIYDSRFTPTEEKLFTNAIPLVDRPVFTIKDKAHFLSDTIAYQDSGGVRVISINAPTIASVSRTRYYV